MKSQVVDSVRSNHVTPLCTSSYRINIALTCGSTFSLVSRGAVHGYSRVFRTRKSAQFTAPHVRSNRWHPCVNAVIWKYRWMRLLCNHSTHFSLVRGAISVVYHALWRTRHRLFADRYVQTSCNWVPGTRWLTPVHRLTVHEGAHVSTLIVRSLFWFLPTVTFLRGVWKSPSIYSLSTRGSLYKGGQCDSLDRGVVPSNDWYPNSHPHSSILPNKEVTLLQGNCKILRSLYCGMVKNMLTYDYFGVSSCSARMNTASHSHGLLHWLYRWVGPYHLYPRAGLTVDQVHASAVHSSICTL